MCPNLSEGMPILTKDASSFSSLALVLKEDMYSKRKRVASNFQAHPRVCRIGPCEELLPAFPLAQWARAKSDEKAVLCLTPPPRPGAWVLAIQAKQPSDCQLGAVQSA